MATPANEMTAIEIARKFAELNYSDDACRAYALVLNDKTNSAPEELLEGAVYTLQFGSDYKVSYDAFLDLYRQGHYREDILSLLTDAFYAPNEQELKKRYELNCRLLGKYPYCFRKDFLPFEELPIRFYPYDNKSYVPFHIKSGEFSGKVNFGHEVISRNFFKDLDKPILAEDVFSQYELHYLRDNVRKSEWVARENHIYLHYTDWATFCAHLQCLELRELLKEEKIVFLFEEEISRYPIDFKQEFGIDYSRNQVRPIGVREINRLIWHTQLSSHNGGDFFNEIFFGHPNLILLDSLMMTTIDNMVDSTLQGIKDLKKGKNWGGLSMTYQSVTVPMPPDHPDFLQLTELKNITRKDALVAAFLIIAKGCGQPVDPACRIVPTLFLQPHFYNFVFNLELKDDGCAALYCNELERIIHSSLFNDFKYIKTFSPIRRITTSYAATLRFADLIQIQEKRAQGKMDRPTEMYDILGQRVLSRTFMADPDERVFKDSVVVRFEDAKLAPKATFSALAEFLDLPYDKCMEQCRTPEKVVEDGFRTNSVYVTYEPFANREERVFLEYLLRDAYREYGYDFNYYDGSPMDTETLKGLIDSFDPANSFIMRLRSCYAQNGLSLYNMTQEEKDEYIAHCEERIKEHNKIRLLVAQIIGPLPTFVNKEGKKLQMMKLLSPDPSLMENEPYR